MRIWFCIAEPRCGRNKPLYTCFSGKIVCRWQEWHSHVETSDRFNVCMTFCTIPDTKTYLKMNIDKPLKFIMTRFRLGISDIVVHYYSYKRHTDKDLICPLCRVVQETELHFVLSCPVLRT